MWVSRFESGRPCAVGSDRPLTNHELEPERDTEESRVVVEYHKIAYRHAQMGIGITVEHAPRRSGGESMTRYDYNGHRIKPGHSGETAGHPTGPYRERYVWLLAREDDKLFGYWPSRHAAVGALAKENRITRVNRPEWFDPVRVPVASVRTNDVVEVRTMPTIA